MKECQGPKWVKTKKEFYLKHLSACVYLSVCVCVWKCTSVCALSPTQQTKSQQANSFCMQSFSFFYVRFVVSSLQPWCEILRGHLASPGISTGVCVCVHVCVPVLATPTSHRKNKEKNKTGKQAQTARRKKLKIRKSQGKTKKKSK